VPEKWEPPSATDVPAPARKVIERTVAARWGGYCAAPADFAEPPALRLLR
jgi:hypothetical protein